MKSSKELILCISVIMASAVGFIGLNMAVSNPWFVIITLTSLPFAWAIYISLSKNIIAVSLTAILSIATFFIIFPYKIWYLVPTVFSIVALIFGYIVCANLKNIFAKVSISGVASVPTSYLMYGLVTIISFVSFYSSPVQDLKNGLQIPPSVVEIIARQAIPDFSDKTTVDSLISSSLKLPRGQNISNDQRRDVLEQLGLDKYNLKGDDILVDKPEALSDLFTNQLNKVLQNYGDIIPITVASTIWSILIVLAKMFVPIILLFDALLLKLLIRIGFVTISTSTIEKEEMSF